MDRPGSRPGKASSTPTSRGNVEIISCWGKTRRRGLAPSGDTTRFDQIRGARSGVVLPGNLRLGTALAGRLKRVVGESAGIR
uniref:Uncharacterized protein n=1 Tax=Coccidioides posadasii RMSCC 3488 TaxID=454284 RepID=A0A0J6F486_COCPO|nr:hypothetical protein CPAG_00442 [Coccidioides posadasii RMSCC 3488]